MDHGYKLEIYENLKQFEQHGIMKAVCHQKEVLTFWECKIPSGLTGSLVYTAGSVGRG